MYTQINKEQENEHAEEERQKAIPLKEELNKPLQLQHYNIIRTDDYNLAILTVTDPKQNNNIHYYQLASYSGVIIDELEEMKWDPRKPQLPVLVKFIEQTGQTGRTYHKMVYLE